MNPEAFIDWALDPARTLEERYSTELLVEFGVMVWNGQRQIFEHESPEARMARNRERKLNPAYEPRFSEESLAKTASVLPTMKGWHVFSDRPVRSLALLRFLPALERLNLQCFTGDDLSPLAELPALRELFLAIPGGMENTACVDYTPLARCTGLEDLFLGFDALWPDLTGLEALPRLEKLTLGGNLLAMPRGAVFPHVHTARLECKPLHVRSVADLPQLPACEVVTLSGAEDLRGIERWERLRNLTVAGRFRSFEPLAALAELTCLTITYIDHLDGTRQPRDVAPVARLPKLHRFVIGPEHHGPDMPRDYSPLAEAPALRELAVRSCPPVALEVAALNATLPPCDDLYLHPEPPPLGPLRMIIAPGSTMPPPPVAQDDGAGGRPDPGLRECEGRWVGRFVGRSIREGIGHSDWGGVSADGLSRHLMLRIESFEVLGQFPQLIEVARTALARLRPAYLCDFIVCLTVPAPAATAAQQALEKQFRDEQMRWDFERRQEDQAAYLDRLHRLELKKEEGDPVDPREFSPAPASPPPLPPWERDAPEQPRDDDDDGDGFAGEGDVALKEPPEPPPSFRDDDHPLAGNYHLNGRLAPDRVFFLPQHRALAVYLMGREPDEEIATE